MRDFDTKFSISHASKQSSDMPQNNFSQQKQLGASHECMLASFADVSGFYTNYACIALIIIDITFKPMITQ
jgi:hypothetical protein